MVCAAWKSAALSGYGDCIDCSMCVQVCPAGHRYPRRACNTAASPAACASMRATASWIDGLPARPDPLRFGNQPGQDPTRKTSLALEAAQDHRLWHRAAGHDEPISFSASPPAADFERSVSQVRQPLFVTLSNGDIRDRYQIRITNTGTHDETYVISARDLRPPRWTWEILRRSR